MAGVSDPILTDTPRASAGGGTLRLPTAILLAFAAAFGAGRLAPAADLPGAPAAANADFEAAVKPVLQRSCYACHNAALKNADVNLMAFESEAAIAQDHHLWSKVVEKMRTRVMPPAPFPPLSDADLALVTGWIEEPSTAPRRGAARPGSGDGAAAEPDRVRQLGARSPGGGPAPGRGLPPGRHGLRLRQQRRRALALARPHGEVPDRRRPHRAGGPLGTRAARTRAGAVAVDPGPDRAEPRTAARVRRRAGSSSATRSTPPTASRSTADYVVRLVLGGERPAGSEPVELGLFLDDQEIASGSLDPRGLRRLLRGPAGIHGQDPRVPGASGGRRAPPLGHDRSALRGPARVLRRAEPLEAARCPRRRSSGRRRTPLRRRSRSGAKSSRSGCWRRPRSTTPGCADRGARARTIPFAVPPSASRRVFPPAATSRARCGGDCARKILAPLLRRAYRRPVTAADSTRSWASWPPRERRGESFHDGLRAGPPGPARVARLPVPHRAGPAGRDGGRGRALTDHELGARLASFLWASLPDDALLDLADRGTLGRPDVLEAQVRRMLQRPEGERARGGLRRAVAPVPRRWSRSAPTASTFPTSTATCACSMRKETELFFDEHRARGPEHARPARRAVHLPERAAGPALRHRRV